LVSSEFFARPALIVAKELIGKLFVYETAAGRCSGVIVETEAYAADDPASHSFRGPTQRNAVMFDKPGLLYVYQTYGIHYCCNIVTGSEHMGEAVLIRALQPVEGLELMRERRGETVKETKLCSGPANLVKALGLSLADNGRSACSTPLHVEDLGTLPEQVIQTTRIGISRAMDLPWRFYDPKSPAVSKR